MNTLNSQHLIPGVHLGTVMEAGNLDDNDPAFSGVVVKMPVHEIVGGQNIVYQPVAVIRADEMIVGEIVGFDAEANEITFRLEDLRATGAVAGAWWVLRFNPA